jgi:serine/threonine protein kinase
MNSHYDNNKPLRPDAEMPQQPNVDLAPTNLGEIDLLANPHLHPATMPLIFHKDNTYYYFPAGKNSMWLRDERNVDRHYEFTTPHSLGIRKDKYGNLVCDIYDTQLTHALGKGTFGTVFNVIGSVKYRYDKDAGYTFENDAGKSVVKVGVENPELGANYVGQAYMDSILNEHTIASHLPHLRAREPLFISQNNRLMSAQLFRKIKGSTLNAIMLDRKQLSNDDLFQLSIALYKALINQFHANGYIHCDIKPENIMVYKDEKGWHVNIIDTNLSVRSGTVNPAFSGTRNYADNDALAGKVSEKTDNYAMSLTVKALWGSDLTNDKDQSWKVEVLKIIEGGCHPESEHRYSSSQCISALELASLHYRRETERSFKYDKAEAGLRAGIQAREMLANKFALDMNSIIKNSEIIKTEMKKIISSLPDNRDALYEFIHTVGAKSLHGFNTVSKLKHEVSHLLDRFSKKYSELTHIGEDMQVVLNEMIEAKCDVKHSQALKKCIHDLAIFTERLMNKKATTTVFDTIDEETEHLQRKIFKTKSTRNYFRSLLPKQSLMSRLQRK